MECKYCGSEEIEYRPKPPHVGAYCVTCGRFQCWIKHTDNPKTPDEYRNDYLDKQPATTEQLKYIYALMTQTAISKLRASKIIGILKEDKNA